MLIDIFIMGLLDALKDCKSRLGILELGFCHPGAGFFEDTAGLAYIELYCKKIVIIL